MGWVLGMQCEDGGWASFEADNNRLYLNNIPFADHGALLDPPTEDITGRVLEVMGTLGMTAGFEPAARAVAWIRRAQRHDGPWYGRWGVNYIYGTWSVLRGLRADRRGSAPGVHPARRPLARAPAERRRRAGASRATATGAPSWRVSAPRCPARRRGRSWACSRPGSPAVPTVERGIAYLLRDAGPRRHLGGPALEWHGIPPRVLPQVPLLREVLSPLGAGRVSTRRCMTRHPASPGSCAPSRRSGAGPSTSRARSAASGPSWAKRC